MLQLPDDYGKILKEFDLVCQTAFRMSANTADRQVSESEYYADLIFAKICLTAIALTKFLPGHANFCPAYGFGVWDISTICILTRSLIDSYNILYFIAVENVNDDEKQFRLLLWKLHSETERRRMLDLIKSRNPLKQKIEDDISQLRSELINSPFFQQLDSKMKRCAERGEFRRFFQRSKVAVNSGISANYADAVYKYLSQYVHTYSFSLADLARFKANELDSLDKIKVTLDYATSYLCFAVRDWVRLFQNQEQYLNGDIKRLISMWEYCVKNFDQRHSIHP